jgi:hypothetical protein
LYTAPKGLPLTNVVPHHSSRYLLFAFGTTNQSEELPDELRALPTYRRSSLSRRHILIRACFSGSSWASREHDVLASRVNLLLEVKKQVHERDVQVTANFFQALRHLRTFLQVLGLPGLAESMVCFLEQWKASEPECNAAARFLPLVRAAHKGTLAKFCTRDEMLRLVKALKGGSGVRGTTDCGSLSALWKGSGPVVYIAGVITCVSGC